MEGVDVRYAEGRHSALVAACVGGHLETACVILEHGGQTQEELENAFIPAAREGRLEIVKMMMERGVDPSMGDNDAVVRAAARGRCHVVEFLLRDLRVDPA